MLPDLRQDRRKILTFSQMQSFLHCRRKAQLRYEDCLVPRGREHALAFGDLIHESLRLWHRYRNLETVYEYIDRRLVRRHEKPEVMKDWLIARAMLKGYVRRWGNDPFEVVALESGFLAEILDPHDPTRAHPDFILGGKRDGLIRGTDGLLYLLEHKTAASVGSDYLEKLWTDFQITLYSEVTERELGEKVRGVLYNVITKTKIKQGEGETEEAFQARYAEAVASNKSGKTSIKKKEAETNDEFAARLDEVYADRQMFDRQHLIISRDQYQAVREMVWQAAEAYSAAKRRPVEFYQNPGHCFIYHRPCSYYGICSSSNSSVVIENEFDRKEPHEELLEEERIF